MSSLARNGMADSPFLVAMALIDQQGRRALPLGGRSQKDVAPQGEAPEALGHALVLELLLRVWQRSDQGVLQRAAGADSLLLVELPMERLPEDYTLSLHDALPINRKSVV